MTNSNSENEIEGKGCLLMAVIPLAFAVVGMVISIATGGLSDDLLNIDTNEYFSSIFFGFWFLVAVTAFVFIINRKK